MKRNIYYARFIPVLFMLVFYANSYAQDYIGNLTITTQAQIDSFNYYSVTGDLTISGPGIVNINALSSLGDVGRSFYIINTSITNIDSLYNLHGVGRAGVNNDRLQITGNSKLVRFCGLTGLWQPPFNVDISGNAFNPTREEIARFGPCTPESEFTFYGDLVLDSQDKIDNFNYKTIQGNLIINDAAFNNITNLNGLSELNRIYAGLIISENNALVNTDSLANLNSVGYIHILNNGALPDLKGLTGITRIEQYTNDIRSLEITANNNLVNLEGLNNLTAVLGNCLISDNPSLANLQGLSKLDSVRYGFGIENNDALTSLTGLSELNYLFYFSIVNNDNLKNLDGLTDLSALNSLYLTNNNALENIDGLNNLTTVRQLQINGASALTSIKGLSNLEYAERIYIEKADVLTNLDGLEKLNALVALGLFSNKSLTNTEGLHNLLRMGEKEESGNIVILLQVRDNPALKDLNGLRNAKFYLGGYIEIFDNPLLTEFCGIHGLIRLFDDQYSNLFLGNNGITTDGFKIVANGSCSDEKPRTFITALLGSNQTPFVRTEDSGGGMFVLNGSRDSLYYWIKIYELDCPMTYVKFYTDSSGYNAVKDITEEFTIDSTGYLAHGVWTSTDTQPFTESLLDDLMAGKLYVNVHTTGYPSGEMKGYLDDDKPVILYANPDGLQETPPVITPGSGVATFWLSGDGDSLYYNISAGALTGPVAAAHFHKAPFGVAGSPVKTISFTGDTLAAGWWTSSDSEPLTPGLVADLLGCNLYINVHTSNYPSGEIRGQIYKTIDVSADYMTIWGAMNDENQDVDSKLTFYSLTEGNKFENIEGDIYGYDGKRNIVDITIDAGGYIYFLNNTWASMLYRVNPYQLDFNPETSVFAKQMGRTKSADGKYVWLTDIKFIRGALYGLNNQTNILYQVNPANAVVHEIAVINCPDSKASAFVYGADGNIYLLKSKTGGMNELWRFDNFPGNELSFVTNITSTEDINSLTAHPNGNLYAAGVKHLYEINPAIKSVGLLKDHEINTAAVDFNFYSEKNVSAKPTVAFETFSITDVAKDNLLPTEYSLSQNFPNPFNPNTVIRYSLPSAGNVRLEVFNALGETVRILVDETKAAGDYEADFNASGLPSGLYIYKIKAGSFVSTNKMILIK